MKKKIKYLTFSVLVLCFILVNKGSIFAAVNDGSDLVENYIRELGNQDIVKNGAGTDRDGDALTMIEAMLLFQADSNNYGKLTQVVDKVGYVGKINLYHNEVLREQTYGTDYKGDPILFLPSAGDVDTNIAVAAWTEEGKNGIGDISHNCGTVSTQAPENSWHGLLYMISSLKVSASKDVNSILNKAEYADLLTRMDADKTSLEENYYVQLSYEYVACSRVLMLIGNSEYNDNGTSAGIYEKLGLQCGNDSKTNHYIELSRYGAGSLLECVDDTAQNEYGEYVEYSYYKEFLENLTKMAAAVKNYQNELAKRMKKLAESGKIGSDMADAMAEYKDTEESAEQNAADEAWRDYNAFVFRFMGYKNNGVPSMDLGTLSNRLNGLQKAETLSQFDGFNDIIENDILGMVFKIGRYLIYAALLFFGVRCIWEGASGKAQFKTMLPYLLVALVFFYSGRGIVNVVQSAFDTYDYENYGMDVFSTIVYIVRILAFAGILFTGVKLMFAAPEAKADVKSHMIPIIIGCVFVFSSSFIVDIIVTTFDEAGFERSNIVIERNIDVM